jgi:NADH dehydrogenase FAD-containing subunit
VNVLSYESAVPGIHIIGDASKTTQPKAGHIANQEAKVCADAVTRLLRGDTKLDQNLVTNSACFSPITATQASWLTAVFHYDPVSRTMKKYLRPAGSNAAGVLADGEAGQWTAENFSQMGKWFNQLMADTYA